MNDTTIPDGTDDDAKRRKPRGGPKGSLLRDPQAEETLRRAADAIGCTVAQLVALAVDSGAIVAAGSDALAEQSTFGDVGRAVWTRIAQVPKDERSKWFTNLTTTQRTTLVATLRDEGFAAQVIGRELGIEPERVESVYAEYADRLGDSVVNVRLNTLAGGVELASQRAQQGAVDKDDWALFWRIAKDKVKVYQDLGVVERAAQRVEHTHRLEDVRKEQIDAMVSIEQKRLARTEEIKRAEAEVLDTVPELAMDEPYGEA